MRQLRRSAWFAYRHGSRAGLNWLDELTEYMPLLEQGLYDGFELQLRVLAGQQIALSVERDCYAYDEARGCSKVYKRFPEGRFKRRVKGRAAPLFERSPLNIARSFAEYLRKRKCADPNIIHAFEERP